MDPGAGLPYRAGSSSGGGSEARGLDAVDLPRGNGLHGTRRDGALAVISFRDYPDAGTLSIRSCPARCSRWTSTRARFHRTGDDSCSKPTWMAAPSSLYGTCPSTGLVVLSGTEGAFGPFWSSDSRSIAFFSLNGGLKQLKRIPADGRARTVIWRHPVVRSSIPTDGTMARRGDPVHYQRVPFPASPPWEARPPLSRRFRGSPDAPHQPAQSLP